MYQIHDEQGALIDVIPLSPKLQEAVEAGGRVSIRFHMPKALKAFGHAHVDGNFDVWKADGRYVTDDPASAKAYADIQANVRSLEASS